MVAGGTEPESPSPFGQNCDNATVKSYVVHEVIIRTESPFFEAVLSKEWKKSKERVVRLPEQYPEAFDIYARWIYSGKLIISKIDIQDNEAYIILTGNLSRAYILGDVLQDTDFKDAVIDGLFEIIESRNYVHVGQTKFLFNNTLKESPIRRMLVDWVVIEGDLQALCKEEYEQWTTVEFFQNLIKRQQDKDDGKFDEISGEDDSGDHQETENPQGGTRKKRKLTSAVKAQKSVWKSPSTTSTCKYHGHGEDRPCYKVRFGIGRPSKSAQMS